MATAVITRDRQALKGRSVDFSTSWGQPHDLLWVVPERLQPLDGEVLATWTRHLIGPVVVRRGLAPDGHIAVGLRGSNKLERQAATIARTDVITGVQPDTLAHVHYWADYRWDHPTLQRLHLVAPILNQWIATHHGDDLQSWGITGSLGYELASGLRQLHPDSDLDLVLRCPQPLNRQEAKQLWAALNQPEAHTRLDIQLETPNGAIALAEWASDSPQVLLKTAQGPRLTDQPWYEQATREPTDV